MKTRKLIAGTIGVCLLVATGLQAADTTLFVSRSGSKLRLEGTSSVHDWQVETPFIGGSLEAGPDFPKEQGQSVNPGKVNGMAQVFVTVRGLKSIEKDGKPYSDKMDEVMWEKLKVQQNSKILYRSTELVLKGAPASKDAPYVLDTKGELVVAGATNKISMPVNVLPMADKKLKISGATNVKMTDFGIEPVKIGIGALSIKTGDEVKVSFEWIVAPKAPAASAAK
jgi:YceI-like protein